MPDSTPTPLVAGDDFLDGMERGEGREEEGGYLAELKTASVLPLVNCCRVSTPLTCIQRGKLRFARGCVKFLPALA